jgi:hypothetical protein
VFLKLGTGTPNLSLAKELLKRREPEVVAEYFGRLSQFWTQAGELLKGWVEVIRAGRNPEFDLLFLVG